MRIRYLNRLFVMLAFLLAGCSTKQDNVLPQPNTNVKQVWEEAMGQNAVNASSQMGIMPRALDVKALTQKP